MIRRDAFLGKLLLIVLYQVVNFPDIILLTQFYYHKGPNPNPNPFKCHEEVLYLQPMIPPKLNVLIFSPPDWGMLRRSRCVLIFL